MADAHCLQVEEAKAAKQAEKSAEAAAAAEAAARSPARPATPPPRAPPAKPAAAAALSPASSVDMVDMRYSLDDDDLDDPAEELESAAPVEPPQPDGPAAQPPAEETTAAPLMHLIEAAKHTSSPTIDVETWLQSVGLLLRQCPWEAAAKAEGSAAQQSLLQPLLGLLGQLVAAASDNVHVEAIVSIVVQVIVHWIRSLRLVYPYNANGRIPALQGSGLSTLRFMHAGSQRRVLGG